MKKVFVSVILSLSLLSLGELLVNPCESKIINKKVLKEELNKQLIESIIESNIKSVKELISKGANVNSVIKEGDYKGFTPLIFACESGSKDLVELLISKGANVNVVVKDGENKGLNALKVATINNFKNIVKLLKKHGAK